MVGYVLHKAMAPCPTSRQGAVSSPLQGTDVSDEVVAVEGGAISSQQWIVPQRFPACPPWHPSLHSHYLPASAFPSALLGPS